MQDYISTLFYARLRAIAPKGHVMPPVSPSPDKSDYRYVVYEAIWKNMERENALINNRMQWAIVLSAGIFATEGILLGLIVKSMEGENVIIALIGVYFMLFLSIIAAYFSFATRIGVNAAREQIYYLERCYSSYGGFNSNEFEINLGLPRPFGDAVVNVGGHSAARVFPIVMLMIWMSLSVAQLSVGSVLLYNQIGKSHIQPTPQAPSPNNPIKPTKGTKP